MTKYKKQFKTMIEENQFLFNDFKKHHDAVARRYYESSGDMKIRSARSQRTAVSESFQKTYLRSFGKR